MKVAALYVEALGCYSNASGLDLWDKERDARKYAGPNPVVAHPPCNLWVNFAALNYKRYGGEHNRPGNDGGCFESAFLAVKKWGGVLEHPAFTKAWATYNIPRPEKDCWVLVGSIWVCEVWQSAYGHKARKRTWLAYSGKNPPEDMNWVRNPGSHQCGWFDRNKPTLGKKQASETPVLFRDALLSLARKSGGASP